MFEYDMYPKTIEKACIIIIFQIYMNIYEGAKYDHQYREKLFDISIILFWETKHTDGWQIEGETCLKTCLS